MPADRVPASACRISTKTSIVDLGKNSLIMTGSIASLLTFEISILLRSGPGLFRSSTEKDAML